MKLTKLLLSKSLTPKLKGLGYLWVKDSCSLFKGLYIKKADHNMYITLGLTIDRYYDDAFTCDLYYGKTTRIGCVWGDIPSQCYVRPGFLLTDKELEKYREKGSLLKDIWWNGLDMESIDDFVRVLALVEPRLTNNTELRTKIEESIDGNQLYSYSKKVREIVLSIPELDYKFQPPKIIDDIPCEWFKAAEFVLSEEKAIVNNNTVKLLAGDAYRQFLLNKLEQKD